MGVIVGQLALVHVPMAVLVTPVTVLVVMLGMLVVVLDVGVLVLGLAVRVPVGVGLRVGMRLLSQATWLLSGKPCRSGPTVTT